MPNITITLSDDTHARLEALVRHHNWCEAREHGQEGRFMTLESSATGLVVLAVNEGYEAEVKDVSDEYEAMAREIEELCADRSATTDYDTRCDYDRDIASAEEEQDAITERMTLLRLPAPVGPEVPQ